MNNIVGFLYQKKKKITKRVPQGSLLSPFLYKTSKNVPVKDLFTIFSATATTVSTNMSMVWLQKLNGRSLTEVKDCFTNSNLKMDTDKNQVLTTYRAQNENVHLIIMNF